MSTAGLMVKSLAQPHSAALQALGVEVGKLYTEHGLPLDMALDRLEHPKDQKLSILHGACWWLVEHKRRSGATEKSLERQRAANLNMISSFVRGAELGVY